MRYSLRTLVILTAIGPPLLGILWTQREFLFGMLDAVTQPSAPPPRIVRAPRAARRSQPIVAPSQATDEKGVHFLAGACTVGLYPIAVLMLADVMRKHRDWRRPPKKSASLAAALLFSLLTAAACLLFVVSAPTPFDHLTPSQRDELQRYRQTERTSER